MGRPLEYGRLHPLGEGEAKALTVADDARAKAMRLASAEFLKRIDAEHRRAGRVTAFS